MGRLQYGVSGDVLGVIKAMYQAAAVVSVACVKVAGVVLKLFEVKQRVRHARLSHVVMLFNIFLHEQRKSHILQGSGYIHASSTSC